MFKNLLFGLLFFLLSTFVVFAGSSFKDSCIKDGNTIACQKYADQIAKFQEINGVDALKNSSILEFSVDDIARLLVCNQEGICPKDTKLSVIDPNEMLKQLQKITEEQTQFYNRGCFVGKQSDSKKEQAKMINCWETFMRATEGLLFADGHVKINSCANPLNVLCKIVAVKAWGEMCVGTDMASNTIYGRVCRNYRVSEDGELINAKTGAIFTDYKFYGVGTSKSVFRAL